MRFVAEILLEKLHNQDEVLVAMAKSFAQMTHAMYSFLKRSASSFSSILCFFRGGRYTSLLAIDSADTAICSFDISYRLLIFCIIGIPITMATVSFRSQTIAKIVVSVRGQ